MAYTGVKTYTRSDLADVLQVSPARVSQIAKELGINPDWNGSEFLYSQKQLRLMLQRNTKPGPKKEGGEK